MIFGKPLVFTPWFKFNLQGYSTFENSYVSQKTVLKLFGYSMSAGWLSDYLQTFQKFIVVPDTLVEAIKIPQLLEVTSDGKKMIEEVYSTELLLELCGFIRHAKEEGYIGLLDLKIATTAEDILELNKKIPIKDAISERSGQNFYKLQILEKIANQLEFVSGDPSFKWIGSFPIEFIEKVFRLTDLSWEMGDGMIPELSELLQRIVFNRLPAKISAHNRLHAPKRSYRRKNYKPQVLGNADLDEFLTIVKGLMITSQFSESVLYQLLDKIYPEQKDQILKISVPNVQLSEQETEIKKLIF